MDLTPRALDQAPAGRSPRAPARRWLGVVVLLGIAAAMAFVVSRALTDATLFFYNADEAVERHDELGTDRFRLQGSVVPGTVEASSDGVTFGVTYNGVEVEVRHVGDPPDLFQESIPVVLEGNWEGVVFASDRMLVKHDNTYVEDNGERIDDAERGADSADGYESDAGGDGGSSSDDDPDVDADDGEGGDAAPESESAAGSDPDELGPGAGEGTAPR